MSYNWHVNDLRDRHTKNRVKSWSEQKLTFIWRSRRSSSASFRSSSCCRLSRSACPGIFSTFFGADDDGAGVTGAGVIWPETWDEGILIAAGCGAKKNGKKFWKILRKFSRSKTYQHLLQRDYPLQLAHSPQLFVLQRPTGLRTGSPF